MPTVLRPASWHEVSLLFASEAEAARNADGWAGRFGAEPPDYRHCQVTLEAWTHDEIGALMASMSQIEPRMTVDIVDGVNNAQQPPRVDGLPAAVVRFGERYGMIDGKHRANRWACVPGQYAVLVVRC